MACLFGNLDFTKKESDEAEEESDEEEAVETAVIDEKDERVSHGPVQDDFDMMEQETRE